MLAQLSSPLRFFGLALLVTESAFSGPLIRGGQGDKVTITFGYLMAGLFALSVVTVAVLMLITRTELADSPSKRSDQERLAKATETIARAIAEFTKEPGRSPSEVNSLLDNALNAIETKPDPSGNKEQAF